jgi:hypothetical protein
MTGLLATIRPGPVLHAWQDGREVARVPLDTPAALTLIAALAAEVRAACAPQTSWEARRGPCARACVAHAGRHKARHGPTGGR